MDCPGGPVAVVDQNEERLSGATGQFRGVRGAAHPLPAHGLGAVLEVTLEKSNSLLLPVGVPPSGALSRAHLSFRGTVAVALPVSFGSAIRPSRGR